MDEVEKFLIIGLGNPGAPYKQTRHNVGFNIVQRFAEKLGAHFKHASELAGEIAQAAIREKKIWMLLPTTFMNLSGDAVKRCMDYYKVPVDHLIVVCDDIALPIGKIRMRSKGSCGGHNGLRSVEAHLNTEHYVRLRVGVGGPGSQVLVDYVLGRFSLEEDKVIQEAVGEAVQVLKLWITAGTAVAMQTANSAKNLSKDQVKKEEGDKNG